jgi:uncharacterized RDD family membrane protein YckC
MNIETPGPASQTEYVTVEPTDAPQLFLATPWPRFWARLLDVYLLSMPAAFLLGIVFPTFFIPAADGSPPNPFLIAMVVLPLVMIMDAVVASFFGTTAGKALAGLQVRRIDGKKMSVETSLKRSALVYVKGLALGLPVICLFTYKNGFDAVKDGGLCSWDQDTLTRVYSKSNNSVRTVFVAIAAILMLMILQAIDKMSG